MTFSSIRQSWYSRSISLCIMVTFVTTMVITPKASYAQGGVIGLPMPGTMVNLSSAYVPLMITGLTIHPENPLLMDFIVNTGNSGMNADQVKKESDRLIKYFLACLTIPENNQWVNLSPYEKDRIVPQDLGQTVLGQDMLEQDYILKQLTASLIYPEKNLGKNFWDKVYAKANQMYGTTQIPVNTFNKVWILPDTAKVFEHKDTVFVVKSHLKVMLDQDYLSMQKHMTNSPSFVKEGVRGSSKDINNLGSNIVRQIILPAIEQEVNTGKNFAQLRQIYNSMILAFWFKNNLKQALLNQVYTDKSKVSGVNVDDPAIKEKIYQQYVQAYKKGVFNYIKEEVDQNSQEIVPRKYFSGGLEPISSLAMVTVDEAETSLGQEPGENFRILGKTQRAPSNTNPPAAAMTAEFTLALGKTLGNAVTLFMIDERELPLDLVTDVSVSNPDGSNKEKIHISSKRPIFGLDQTYRTPMRVEVTYSMPIGNRETSGNNEGYTHIKGQFTGNAGSLAMVHIERLSPQQIMERFDIASPDALYLSVLIAKYLSDRIMPVLGKNGIPSALLNKEARQSLFGVLDAKELMSDPANLEAAKQVHIRVLQLKGGLGTSFKRKATVKRLTGRDTLADKGTDSYFENIPVAGFDASGNPKQSNENISVAELKLLYYIHLAQQKEYSNVEVQELVNAESRDAVNKFWDTPYLADRVDDRIPANEKRTYRQIFSDPQKGIKGLSFNPDFILQGILPVVNAENGEYLNNEALRSPGGHAAFVALTMDDNAHNQRDLTVPQITVFTNGDGVNNMLPPAVAGWMVRTKAPIVMVTTTKQLLDLKGGLITLLSNTELPVNIREKLAHFETLSMEDIADLQSSLYPYLLEIAQAKSVGQQDIFQKMGITLGEKSAQFFNTNMHAQNHNVLDPFLAELKGIIGDEKFYEIIGPDLIVNPKDKKVDDKPVKVIQLEGASGSALLAMNRFILTATDPRIIALKEKYGITRLVYFVNFDEKLRSEVFTPEKYTWDHYLYAFTDLFLVDPIQGRLTFTPRPGRSTLPGFDLDAPYEDLEYDINAFGRKLGVKELDYLAIRGEVRIPNAILKGGVFIRNRSGKGVDLTTKLDELPSENGHLVLSNVFVDIDQDGNVTTKPVTNLLEAIRGFESGSFAMQTAIDDGTADELNETSPAMTAITLKDLEAGINAMLNGHAYEQGFISVYIKEATQADKGYSMKNGYMVHTISQNGIDIRADSATVKVSELMDEIARSGVLKLWRSDLKEITSSPAWEQLKGMTIKIDNQAASAAMNTPSASKIVINIQTADHISAFEDEEYVGISLWSKTKHPGAELQELQVLTEQVAAAVHYEPYNSETSFGVRVKKLPMEHGNSNQRQDMLDAVTGYLTKNQMMPGQKKVKSYAMTTEMDARVLKLSPELNPDDLDIIRQADKFGGMAVRAAVARVQAAIQQSITKFDPMKKVFQENMARLQRGEKIVMRYPVRLYDGGLSSFDLWEFGGATADLFPHPQGFEELPALAATISDMDDPHDPLYIEVTIEKGEQGKVTYNALDYKVTGYQTDGTINLDDKGRVPDGAKGAPGYWAALLGVNDVNITVKLSNPKIRDGGLEGSNVVAQEVEDALTEIIGAKLSDGDKYGLGLVSSLGPFGDITGYQGGIATKQGNGIMYFLGNVKDGQGKVINPYSVMWSPLFRDDNVRQKIQQHLILGKLVSPTNDAINRTASLVNTLWTIAVINKNHRALEILKEQLKAGHDFKTAQQAGDITGMQKALDTYIKCSTSAPLGHIDLKLIGGF